MFEIVLNNVHSAVTVQAMTQDTTADERPSSERIHSEDQCATVEFAAAAGQLLIGIPGYLDDGARDPRAIRDEGDPRDVVVTAGPNPRRPRVVVSRTRRPEPVMAMGVVRAAGLHVSHIDGSELVYNQENPWLPDLLICRPELAAAALELLK